MSQQHPFKWRHFQADIILFCVRWYLRYALSYRDVEEMMQERGLSLDHTTIFRWVQTYAPELEKRCRPHLKAYNDSWRVDAHLHQDQENMGVPLSGSGFRWPDPGVSPRARHVMPRPPSVSSSKPCSPQLAHPLLLVRCVRPRRRLPSPHLPLFKN